MPLRLPPILLTAWLLAVVARPAPGQRFPVLQRVELSDAVTVDETDSAAKNHLRRAEAFLAEGQWDEAVETLRGVMTQFGEKLIELPNHRTTIFPTRRWVDVRQFCQLRLSSLPPEALQLYRRRVDPLAQAWYERGLEQRDEDRLLDVVEDFFCSSWGDDALLALGDLAASAGRPSQARNHWLRILPPPPGDYAAIPQDFYEATRRAEALPESMARLLDETYASNESALPPRYELIGEPSEESSARLVRFWKSQGYLTALSYPDTDVNVAAVEARLVLATILEGDLDRAREELLAFARLHPEATGRLAGREGRLTLLLAAQLQSAEGWQEPPTPDDWPTFAGDVDRNRVADLPVDINRAIWSREIEPVALPDPLFAVNYGFRFRRVAENSRTLLSYHPVVVSEAAAVEGPLVLYNDLNHVYAFRLSDGEPAWPVASDKPEGAIFSPENKDETVSQTRRQGYLGAPRFTLTVSGNKVFARLGSPITVPGGHQLRREPDYLVCLDLSTSGAVVWKFPPDDERRDYEDWALEGAPVCDGVNVYLGMRHGGVRSQAHVACLDADTGRLRWRRFICGADTPGRGQVDEATHNLLTLAGGTLYYNTNLGAVASLSPRDGKIHWLSAYPRSQSTESEDLNRKPAHYYRDLNPAVFHRGKLLVAPADCESLFCLDAGSGQLLWQSSHPEDAVHLLGVGRSDHLLASGDRLWWFDVRTGKPAQVIPAGENVLYNTSGRGVLAGDKVYLPTHKEILVFDQDPRGGSAQQPIRLKQTHGADGGNLIVAAGHLLVASAERLYAFPLAEGNDAGGENVKE